MKFNWKVRVKNPYFWTGLIAVLFLAMDVDVSTLTSWKLLYERLVELVSNPFMLGTVAVALFTYVQDFTTKGPGDSSLAMVYEAPRVCKGEKEVK